LRPFTAWRLAVARGNDAELRGIRAQLESASTVSIRGIAMASQFDAVAIEDGEAALRQLHARATDRESQIDVLLAEHSLALNRGQSRTALDATRRIQRVDGGGHAYLRLRILDGIYGGGDSAAAVDAAHRLERLVAERSLDTPDATDSQLADLCVVAQWRLFRHDTSGVAAISRWLALARPARAPAPAGAMPMACARLLDPWLAVVARHTDAVARVRAAVSLAFTSAAAGDAALYAPIAISRLFEALGDRTGALRAIRRRPYMTDWPRYLAAEWSEEVRLASALGIPDSAARAGTRLIIFRGNPRVPSAADRGGAGAALHEDTRTLEWIGPTP
jgi:hypothetical protein